MGITWFLFAEKLRKVVDVIFAVPNGFNDRFIDPGLTRENIKGVVYPIFVNMFDSFAKCRVCCTSIVDVGI